MANLFDTELEVYKGLLLFIGGKQLSSEFGNFNIKNKEINKHGLYYP